jgi:hypothetical protein
MFSCARGRQSGRIEVTIGQLLKTSHLLRNHGNWEEE